MSEITTYQSVTITDLMKRLDTYKHNPSAIQQVVYNYLDEVTSGQVNIVDPTNPFVFLLESSAVNTALAINEHAVGLRKQYPSLSQTESDLYHHLSDKDYLDRFATPADVTFTVVMLVSDVLEKMERSDAEGCLKATIPRDSRFTIDDYTFTLQYPIDIRKFDNGVVKITYDADIPSKLDGLTSNVIDYFTRTDTNGVRWLFFDVNVKQFAIESTNFPLQKSMIFNQTLPHSDQFYFIRAFYRNNDTNSQWVEMSTSHTDQVFDPFKPTALIQVYEQFIKVHIPPVYLTSNLISGEVRFDLYTTKGALSVNLANYKADAFGLSPLAINEERDLSAYTNALNSISYYTYSRQFITGGTNGVDFATLRNRVIDNATGVIDIPITNKRLETFVGNKGFELVKNVDTVTNRAFLATQRLPKPTNVKLATSANIGIGTIVASMTKLKTLPTVRFVNNRVTILSSNLYRNKNGIIEIIEPTAVAALRAMTKTALVNHVNNQSYLYSPFYYVLDDSNEEFEVRAYNLDYPVASSLSFISQNQSLQLTVNTDQYSLEKISQGYKLTVITKSGNFYKQLTDGSVSAQIAYKPMGEARLAFINGTLTGKSEAEERIYEFILETNYDINADHGLCITNANMFGNGTVDTWLDLSSEFHIFYSTSSIIDGFRPDEADSLLGKFILPNNSVAVTHESLLLSIGSSLRNLWTRSRSMPSGQDYARHDSDVPMFYTEDVYETNPVTGKVVGFGGDGTIQYNILHRNGDPVLDNAGHQVFKHRKNDIVLDVNGDPVIDTVPSVTKEFDMLFVDGRHYFVDDAAFISYNHELVAVIDTWINNDLSEISDILLEKTRIFFYPKTTLGNVAIYIEDSGQDLIPSEQSLIVDLYVKSDIFNDTTIRAQLTDTTVQVLDKYITGSVINMTIIEEDLKASYGNSVQSFAARGLGGSKNYRLVTLVDNENRLALKKILFQQQDTSLIIKEDVTVNFLKVL